MLLVAVLVVSMNLRGAITAVGPVLPEISADLGLSGTSAGLLTALPVLCFALLAPASGWWFGKRVGVDRAILLSCLVIAAGTAVRVFDGAPVLFAATFFIGAAMTVGNVLIPVVVKRDFAHRAGSVTGMYTAALIVGAASAAGLTAPISAATSWRFGLAIWAVLAFAAAIVWYSATRRHGTSTPRLADEPPDLRAVRRAVWRSPVAWSVALVLGAQAAAYYAVTAWLPTLLVDEVDASLQTAGFGMSLFQVVGLVGTFAVASLATVRDQQVWLGGIVAGLWLIMLGGLLVAPQWWLVWSMAGGLGQGMGITLALTLVALRSRDADIAHDMSAMAQLVGYTAAAVAPFVVGAVYDATGAWRTPLVILIVITGSIAVFGTIAGRNRTVGVSAPDYQGLGRSS